MILVTGGFAQGKKDYVTEYHRINEEYFVDGALLEVKEFYHGAYHCINHFHLFLKKLLLNKMDMERMIKEVLTKEKNTIIITDEIGSGIIPFSAFDREYRERVGRICCYLAQESEEVIHVVCGIGKKIK